MLQKPENGIGWTPDEFEVTIYFPNGPYTDPAMYTWELAVERARRLIEAAGDPVFAVEIRTQNPLRSYDRS